MPELVTWCYSLVGGECSAFHFFNLLWLLVQQCKLKNGKMEDTHKKKKGGEGCHCLKYSGAFSSTWGLIKEMQRSWALMQTVGKQNGLFSSLFSAPKSPLSSVLPPVTW